LGFVFNLFPAYQTGFVWASWTIGVEMIFYALFPLIYGRVRNVGNALAFCFLCLVAWTAIQHGLGYVVTSDLSRQSILQWSVFKYLPSFAVGGLVYLLFVAFRARQYSDEHAAALGNAFMSVGLFVFVALIQGWLPNVFGSPYYWEPVVYGSLLLGLGLSPRRIVVNAATRFLGKISYSLYLIHPTVVFLLTPVYQWLYGLSPFVTVGFAGSVLVTFSIIVPVSYLTYTWIEKPGIRWGKEITLKLRAAAKVRADSALAG
jgi:peptidoglycan/LPS O-acetylase OafA/YrhL